MIDQLENYNSFDDHTLFNFLWDVKKLREEISSNQNFMTKMKKRNSANRKKDKKMTTHKWISFIVISVIYVVVKILIELVKERKKQK